MGNSKTKDQLTVYLAKKTLNHFAGSGKCLVSTKNGAESTCGDVSDLSSNHEEADTMVVLHAVYAASKGHVVHILSPDTDVFVLAIRRQIQLGEKSSIIAGTGDKRRLVSLKSVRDAMGDRISEALPGFHAFTGSDTTGKFAGKGKIKCWNTLKTASANVITAFCQLGKTFELPEDVFVALEEFVCRLYCPRSNVVSIAMIRWQMFRKSQAEAEKLPPTQAALRNHILRAHYQALIWS